MVISSLDFLIVILSFLLIETLKKESLVKKVFSIKKVNYIGKISY